MINFRDFVPEIKDKGGFFSKRSMEQLSESLDKANDWVTEHKINVVNIETIVLPQIHGVGKEGSTDVALPMGVVSTWYQFIRVWYRND